MEKTRNPAQAMETIETAGSVKTMEKTIEAMQMVDMWQGLIEKESAGSALNSDQIRALKMFGKACCKHRCPFCLLC